MAENPISEHVGSDFLTCESDKMGTQKISVSDQTNRLQFTNFDSDSFIVDMDRLSLLADKDITANSRITLQRSLSRKVAQQKSSEKKINSSIGNEKDNNCDVSTNSSPRAANLARPSAPETPMVVAVGTKDQPTGPRVHHQITIMTGKRLSFWRSLPASWAVDPRKILLFFATLSSMGTMLLICFTLAIGKLGGEDSTALN